METARANHTPIGILKNSSYQASPPLEQTAVSPTSPALSGNDLTDKDITLANTLQNAGPRRQSSSGARPSGASRRHSSNQTPAHDPNNPDGSPRLKWDEANLYLTEQEKSSTMKIDEPKTPYAKRYDPGEDEDEIRTLDARDIAVDELDSIPKSARKHARESDIPGLELGEPEEAVPEGAAKSAVLVAPDEGMEIGHGEGEEGLVGEELEKHRRFQAMRKRHYEMKDVKGLLG
jgi:protein phosphatase inhibitor 2